MYSSKRHIQSIKNNKRVSFKIVEGVKLVLGSTLGAIGTVVLVYGYLIVM